MRQDGHRRHCGLSFRLLVGGGNVNGPLVNARRAVIISPTPRKKYASERKATTVPWQRERKEVACLCRRGVLPVGGG